MNGKPVFEVPAKSVLNLESGFRHKLLCDGMTFTAGSACAYSCSFCYVADLMRKNPHWKTIQEEHAQSEFHNVVIRRTGAPAALKNKLFLRGEPRYLGEEQRGRVIYASPLVDIAANMELVAETVAMCRLILQWTAWDIRLLSKSTFLPRIAEQIDDFFDGKARVIYGVSTGTLDDNIAKAFEQGTPRVTKRLESLEKLQLNGNRTFGMLCPSLPLPGGQNEYQKMAADMAHAIDAQKCEHVWAEVINLRGDSFTMTTSALHSAGFTDHAAELHRVSIDTDAWEYYARDTFEAHAPHYPPGKLRFLQYKTAANKEYWESQIARGAVLL